MLDSDNAGSSLDRTAANAFIAPPLSRTWLAGCAAITAFLAVFLTIYWDQAALAVRVWYASRTYNHGFLILPIVAYLIRERRAALDGLAPRPFFWALPLLPVLGALWLVANAMAVIEAQQLILVAMIEVALLAILGIDIFRRLAFPFLYLFFLIPVGEFLVPTLQDFTASFVVSGLRLTGIPVFSDGVFISIPNGNFEVAEACAGLRFLIATIAFGFLFADLSYRSWWRRIAFIALCIVTPIIANGLRAYGIVLIAHLSNNQLAVGVDHIVYGWLFFSLVTVALIATGSLFRDRDRPSAAVAPRRAVARSAGSRTGIALAAALVLLLAILPRAFAAYLEQRDAAASATPALALALPAAPWQAAADDGSWRPSFASADATLVQSYSDGRRTVRLFIAFYRSQAGEKKLISFANRLAPEGWDIAGRGARAVAVDGVELNASELRLVAKSDRREVLSWFWVDRSFVAGTLRAKLLHAKARLLEGRPEAAVVALAADYDEDPAQATAAIGDLLAHFGSIAGALETVAGR